MDSVKEFTNDMAKSKDFSGATIASHIPIDRYSFHMKYEINRLTNDTVNKRICQYGKSVKAMIADNMISFKKVALRSRKKKRKEFAVN